MFSLIITIISIALVAALALATLYYGGSAFNRGNDSAEAARLINEGQQVNGAVTIAKADFAAGGTEVTTWAGLLSGNYLSQLPSGLGLVGTDPITAVSKVVSTGVCGEINKRAGHVDAITAADASAAPGVYGCGTIATKANTFYFKM